MRAEEKKNRVLISPLIPHPSSLKPSLIPHPSSLKSSLYLVWALTATLTLAFVSLIVIAPVALSNGHDFGALVIYTAFGKFCHQIPERSFYIAGHPLAVCARCTGIYFGFAAAVMIYPFVRSLRVPAAPLSRRWLFVALVPIALDFALDFFGILENTLLSRTATGALLGSVTAFFVVAGLLDLNQMRARQSVPDEIIRTRGAIPNE